MQKKLLGVGLSLVAIMGFLVVAPSANAAVQEGEPPATTAVGYARCPSGYFCGFIESNGGGLYTAFKLGSNDLRVPINGYVFDNRFRSVCNNTSTQTWWLHPDYYFQGLPTQAIGWNYCGNLGEIDVVSSLSHS